MTADAGPLTREFETAAAIIAAAAEVARQGQHRLLDVAPKTGPADLVSQIDRELDAFIVSRLLAEFPADGSLSEEGGRQPGTSGRTWVVDPIDGTHNYIAGLPYFGISIALMAESQTLLGLIHDATDRTLHAAALAPAPGVGRRQDPASGPAAPPAAVALSGSRRPLPSRGQLGVSSALVAVNLPMTAIFSGAGLRSPLDRIGDIRITGSLTLDLVRTGTGQFDACVYRHRDNPWDWAAGEVIAASRGRPVVSARWAVGPVVIVGHPDVTAALVPACDSGPAR